MAQRARTLPNYTSEDYLHWDGRWELIRGIPHAMTPMPSRLHQSLAGRIHSVFLEALKDTSCDCEVYQPIDIRISKYTVVNPDLSIVCQIWDDHFLDFPPSLVVEILSPSTRLKDLNDKFDLYQDFGVKYYVIVDPENNSIAVYHRNNDGQYEKADNYNFDLSDQCAIKAELDKIWN